MEGELNTPYDRINQCVTGSKILTGPGSFWPEPDWITSQKKITGFDRISKL